jgi:hypothetical protein
MSTHDGWEKCIGGLVGKTEGKTNLEDLIIDERLTLKWTLKYIGKVVDLLMWLRRGTNIRLLWS